MFKLHRTRAVKSGEEKLDFKFSQLKALQVPKGWDKLFVSIISVETGKTIAKSSKAPVRSGTCQWTENITESVWVSKDDSSKELEECLYKLVVAMGSARSGILGEATVNITSYVTADASVSVSVPLKRCNYGTNLQFKIQCLTPRTNLRDDDSKERDSLVEDPNGDSVYLEVQSDGSGNALAKGAESYSSKELDLTSHQEDLKSQVTSFSSSDSRHSSDSSGKSSVREDNCLGETMTNGGQKLNGREHYSEDDPSEPEVMESENYNIRSLRNASSSKDLMEAAEDTIQELRKEAKMWERNAQKLMLDLEILRDEFADQSKKQINLDIELAASRAERDGLRKEVERLNLLLETSIVEKQGDVNEGTMPIQKELEEEIRFQKETNDNLALQLSRSQESNIELVSVLQELEEIVEKQKAEIENLVSVKSRFDDMERSLMTQLEEKKNLNIKLKQLEESEKDLQAKLQIKEEYESKLSAKEEEIVSLRAKLLEFTDQRSCDDSMVKEMESLKEKLQELERDCNELTEENLDLLFKLKDINNGSPQRAGITYELASCDYSAKSVSSSSDLEASEYCQEDKHKKKKIHKEAENRYELSIQEFESLKLELESKSRDLVEKTKLEEVLQLKEAEIQDLQRENIQLQENLQAMQRESEMTFKCLSDLQNDLSVLSTSFDSHVSANKILERKSSELESRKCELEFHLSELERENAELSDYIFTMEAELRNLKNEMKSNRLKLQEKEEKLHETEVWLLEARDECDSMKIANGELKKQNLELQKNCADLDAKLNELGDCFESSSVKAEALEESLSLLMEDVVLKEKKLSLELDKLVSENENLEEQVIMGKRLLNQLYMDKTVEVEKLTEQISEIQSLMELKDRELNSMKMEFETKVMELMSAKEKLLKLLENQRLSEEKLLSNVNDLELRITVSEYERQKLAEESVTLKAQLQKMENFKSEKEKAEASLHVASAECRDLKAERSAYLEKITVLEKVVSELEDCKQSKTVLEEKVLCLERDVMAQETMRAEAAELRNELNRIRKENRQYQQIAQRFEEERDEFAARARVLEEEIKVVKEERKNQKHISTARSIGVSKATNKSETARSTNWPRNGRRKPSSRDVARDQQNPSAAKHQREDDRNSNVSDESFLTEAAEIDRTYKPPQYRLSSEAGNSPMDVHGRAMTSEGEVVSRERFEHTTSSLEVELKDLRERYTLMSLKYAEVEAQREELVMKLKAAKSVKRWFS